MGTLAVMDRSGDTKVIWSADNEDEVAQARKTFTDLKAKGFTAYSVDPKDGNKGEVVKEFDQHAQKLIMVPRMVGG